MQYDFITEQLKKQDKGIVLDKIEEINNLLYLHIHKDITLSSHSCSNCGSTSIKIKDYYIRKIKYLTFGNKPSIILYKQRRFICSDCNKGFNEPCGIVTKGSSITTALKINILDETRKKQSFKDIAEDIGVSDTTIYNQFMEHAYSYRCNLTETICIDEFHQTTVEGEYAMIIGDPISDEILDILPSRKQDYIYEYFSSIPLEERLKVKYVVTDLYSSYKTIASELFYKSTYIADRFHWISLATDAFNRTRIEIMNNYEALGHDAFKGTFNKYTLYSKILKSYAKLFLANIYQKEEWFFNQIEVAHYLKKEMRLYEIIEYCLNLDEDLANAYEYLQSLYKLAKFSTFETSRDNILEWCEKIEKDRTKFKHFKKVAATYRVWLEPIINSFIIDPKTKSRIANGFIEGKNNFVKTIKRIGFGFKNFDAFRFKILYSSNKDKPFHF